jgi:uncharacterized protein YkvS
MKVASTGFECLEEGLELFKVLQDHAAARVGDIIEFLEDLEKLVKVQSDQSTLVMEQFSSILTKLVKEEKIAKEKSSRHKKAAVEAAEEAKENTLLAAGLGTTGKEV